MVSSRVHQGSVLGQLFQISIICLEDGIEWTLTKFEGDAALGGLANTLKDKIKIQNDNDK